MIDGPWPIVGEDRPPAEVEQLMQANLLPQKRFRPGFSPLLVNTGSELILFDTGNGAEGFVPPPAGGWLVKSLAAAGYTPEQVDVVVLTHCHPDHIGGLLTDGKPTYPKARYVVGAKEFDFWKGDTALAAPKESNEYRTAVMFRSYLQPLADRARFVDPEGEVAPGIRAVEAYGHTPGHLAYHIESEGKRLLAWGDCAHHEVASLARPEWHALFDQDKQAGVATRRRIYDMAATDRVAVAGYHTSFPVDRLCRAPRGCVSLAAGDLPAGFLGCAMEHPHPEVRAQRASKDDRSSVPGGASFEARPVAGRLRMRSAHGNGKGRWRKIGLTRTLHTF